MAVPQLLLCVFLAIQGVGSFQWSSSSPPDGQVLYVCRNSNVIIPWDYLLDAGDSVGEVTWLYDGHSQEIIAIMTHGQFLVMPAFSHRVQASGTAGLSLTGVQVGDSGNYTIDVQVYVTHDHVLMRRSVFLHVTDQLMTVDGSVHVTQSSEVILDPRTGQYSVQLQCGQWIFADNPPFQVEWVTPEGQVVNSSDYHDHHFTLTLPPPIKGGNYTCRIPPQHADLACLHGNAGHQGEATVTVDKVDAQLSILLKENQQLKIELSQTKNQLSTLSGQVHKLEDAAQHQVAFHARDLQSNHPPSGTPLLFNNVDLNQGQAYNSASGYFVSPYQGLYFFSATTGGTDGNQGAWFYLYVDSTQICTSYNYNDGNWVFSTLHAVLHLNAGQRVWIRGDGSSYISGYDTFFSGFLLSHDFI